MHAVQAHADAHDASTHKNTNPLCLIKSKPCCSHFTRDFMYKDCSCNTSSAHLSGPASWNTNVITNDEHFNLHFGISCFGLFNSHPEVQNITCIVHYGDKDTLRQKTSTNKPAKCWFMARTAA